MSLYCFLCGMTGAFFSGYYPLFKAVPEGFRSNETLKVAVKSFVKIANATVGYLIATKVAEVVLSFFAMAQLSPTSPLTQILFFVFSISFLITLPDLEKLVQNLWNRHALRQP